MDDEGPSTPVEFCCPSCNSRYFISTAHEKTVKFCPFCRSYLENDSGRTEGTEVHRTEVSYVTDHLPGNQSVLFAIGSYQILEKIGQGGMGEVFLAYDTECGRKIALKRIRTDLQSHERLFKRFLKEARLTSQLTHPAIIPIYSIHEEAGSIYYTMPYVEGKTLKALIRHAREIEQEGKSTEAIGASIPTLMRVLLQVCQGIAYSHSLSILHRDIKGENIIIGKYGEVLILDWGLAIQNHQEEVLQGSPATIQSSTDDNTHLGKIVGTPSYLAPERLFGHSATVQSDIYSLGVLLYYILTLRPPFIRKSIKEYRNNVHKEKITPPSEMAPYRDVPPMLEHVCYKCLATNPKERYQNVEELIHDIETYLEGRSEWVEVATLDIKNREDWQFQENVLIAEHTAITQIPEHVDWVSLMISKRSFPQTVRIDTEVTIGPGGHGIGFLVSIPEKEERRHINDGYTLWLGTEDHRATKLLRSAVEVLSQPEIALKKNCKHHIRIEKNKECLYFYLDHQLVLSYISYLPLKGTHIGIISRDADFQIEKLIIHSGGESTVVSCLAVADAFLSHDDFEKALTEYRRIAYTFPGRAEGRDALFRAGVALLEQAKNDPDHQQKEHLFESALDEFEGLHQQHAAPLGYLGKALVYKAQNDKEEEIKCYSLALRRYPHHPLKHLIKEQVIFRLHECSRYNRFATYGLLIIALRHFPEIIKEGATKKLLDNLSKHWEILPFIEEDVCSSHLERAESFQWMLLLSFWLGQSQLIHELIHELFKEKFFFGAIFYNALISLYELGKEDTIQELQTIIDTKNLTASRIFLPFYQAVTTPLKTHFVLELLHTKKTLDRQDISIIISSLREAIDKNLNILSCLHALDSFTLTPSDKERIDFIKIWTFLKRHHYKEAEDIFNTYPLENLVNENSPLFYLYGLWLLAVEGAEIAKAHFSALLDTQFPRSKHLACYFLNGKLQPGDRWYKQSFPWERRELYRQLALYYAIIEDVENQKKYEEKALEKTSS